MSFTSRFFFVFLIFCNLNVEAKLLDKISAIVDDNIITMSQVNRIVNNLTIKKSVIPMIYDKSSYTPAEILKILVNKFLIRSKLAELGYTTTDDQVEVHIKQNLERMGIDRKSLVGLLKQQGTSFDEYFETVREFLEYSLFVNRVIYPMISVSEQDVKNTYYKNNIKDSRMNFDYTLIDYSISLDVIGKPVKGQMEEVVKQYRINAVLPEDYSTLTVNNLDNITEEGITTEFRNLLKATDEGALTSPIVINNKYHVFYLAKKDLVETEAYTSQKEIIKDQIFEKSVKAEIAVWLERERNKHYIKISE